MGRMKDVYCLLMGDPTLNDALKAVGLSCDESRTTPRLVKFSVPHDLAGILFRRRKRDAIDRKRMWAAKISEKGEKP